MCIIANDNKNLNNNLTNNKNKSINEQLKTIAHQKSAKKAEFLDSKKLLSLTDVKDLTMRSVAELAHKRNASFFYNKMNTLYDFSEEYNYEHTFITLTSLRSRKNVENNLPKLIKENQLINKENNLFFRALFKQRIFRNHLTSKDRIYLKSNEFTKRHFLHTHFLMMFNEEYFIQFIEAFARTFINHAKELNIGRTDVVIPKNIYNYLLDSRMFKKSKKVLKDKKIDVLILNPNYFDQVELKNGREVHTNILKENLGKYNEFFLRTLEEQGTKGKNKEKAVLKYATKYVYKNFKDKIDNFDNMSATDALYSETRIRRISFSRFIFPQYLYNNLKDENGTPIHKKYTLTELSIAYNRDNKFKLNLKKNVTFKKVHDNYINLFKESDYLLNLTDWKDNLNLWVQEIEGSEEEKKADYEITEYYARKNLLRDLENCKNFDELEEFLLDNFDIYEDFFDRNSYIKFTHEMEKANISNKYIDSFEFDNCKYFYDYSIKYIMMDITDSE